jgi:glycerate 2-kinase
MARSIGFSPGAVKRMRDKGSRGSGRSSRAAQLLETIALEALAFCDARRAVERVCSIGRERLLIGNHAVSLRGGGRVLVVAYGKAAPLMLEGLITRIRAAGGKRTIRGLVVAPRPPGGARLPKKTAGIDIVAGDHPLPQRASFAAGRRVLRILARVGSADDVIYLASGGGSALMAAPLAPFVTAAEKTQIHKFLIVSGAPISAINAVRKHLSSVKGGRLAAMARRARSQTTLVLCDVDPERYDEVASGPSLPDSTTIDDMVQVVDRYGAAPLLPSRVLEALRADRLPETPKPGNALFRRTHAHLLLSNRDLRHASVRAGLANGLAAEAMQIELDGPVEAGVETAARAIEAAPAGTRMLAMGGEVLTVPLGGGTGGRAQEFALRLALRMRHLSSRPWAFLACGSDGIDGSSPVAGAYADTTTLERAAALKLDPEKILRASDSHRLFRRLHDTVSIPAGVTTLRDLYLLLTGEVAAPGRSVRR